VRIVETIRVKAEGDRIKRGIFRDLPLTVEDPDGTVRHTGFELLEVTRDGSPHPYFTQDMGDMIRVYLGKADVFLEPGHYTYGLIYETGAPLQRVAGQPTLMWNATGTGWAFPIERAAASVRLPGDVEPLEWTALTGPGAGEESGFTGTFKKGTLDVQTTKVLAPNEGLTILVVIPPSAVDLPSE
jgi:hypothetical protein